MQRERLSSLARERIRQANAVDPYYVLAGRDPGRAPSRVAAFVMVALTALLYALYLLVRPEAAQAIAALVGALGAYYAAGVALVRRRR